MKRVLVVANETVAGRPLIEAVKKRAGGEEIHAHVISPQNQPKHGYVIYDEHVRDAAQNRLEMTVALLREAGIEADGEVMDPDPYSAVMDALGEQDYDEIDARGGLAADGFEQLVAGDRLVRDHEDVAHRQPRERFVGPAEEFRPEFSSQTGRVAWLIPSPLLPRRRGRR